RIWPEGIAGTEHPCLIEGLAGAANLGGYGTNRRPSRRMFLLVFQHSRSNVKFMHGMKVLMAKNYIDNLSEETRKGMLEKARSGTWPSCAPLGYLNVVGPEGKRMIRPDPEVAPIIVRLYERYATGNYSVRAMARIARTDG